MITIFLLIINLVIFQNVNCLDLPRNFDADDVSEIIKNVIDQSKNQTFEINSGCLQQLQLFLNNLQSLDDGMWALQMIDASGKVTAGYLTLNVAWMGNYDQCLSIEATQVDLKGKYCLAVSNGTTEAQNNTVNELQLPFGEFGMLRGYKTPVEMQNALNPSIALCIPNQCDINDVRDILQRVVPTQTFAITCQTKEDLNEPLDTGAILTICYFGFFVVLMTICTVCDMYRKETTKLHPLLIAFSVKTNYKRLFRITKNSGEFSCLNGLRFISMMWVVVGHVLGGLYIGPMYNVHDIGKYLKTTKSLGLMNALYAVDTFLVVTGFLVAFSFMKSRQLTNKFNPIIFYLHRYLRLTPPLIPVVLSSIYLIKYLSSGPFYPQTAQYSEVCHKYWWSTLLYVENYVNVDKMCVSQTWYLDIDWQIYLVSPVFLLFLPKKPYIGLAIMLCGTIASMIFTFMVTWDNELPALQSNPRNAAEFTQKYYMKTHTRAGTWFIGAFIGYTLAKIKFRPGVSEKFTLPKWLVGGIWIIVLTILPVCIFAGLDDLNNEEYHAYSNALYNTFARPAWALCIGWIIFACVLDYGGPINFILSLPIFQVLNRFTYSIYLLHLTIVYMMVFSTRQPAYFSVFHVCYSFWGMFALCFGLSIFWVLAFESPIPAVEKYLLGLGSKGRSEKKVTIKVVTTTESTVSSNTNIA